MKFFFAKERKSRYRRFAARSLFREEKFQEKPLGPGYGDLQGRQSNAQSCCFSYLTYCILDRVPLPSLFRKVPNSSSSCESSKCSLSSHKLQCHVGKKYHVTLSRASYSELNRSGGCRPSGKERFSALRASFWSKNKRGRGGAGSPGPSPGSDTELGLKVSVLGYCAHR